MQGTRVTCGWQGHKTRYHYCVREMIFAYTTTTTYWSQQNKSSHRYYKFVLIDMHLKGKFLLHVVKGISHNWYSLWTFTYVYLRDVWFLVCSVLLQICTFWHAYEGKFLLQVVKGIFSNLLLHMVFQLCTFAWRWYLVCSVGVTTAPFAYIDARTPWSIMFIALVTVDEANLGYCEANCICSYICYFSLNL